MMTAKYQKRKRLEGQIKRIAVYSGILFLLAVAESSFFGAIKYLPATPDLILAALVAIAITDTPETAVVSAIIGGVLADAVGGVGNYLSPAFYFATVLIICIFSKKMMRSYLSYLALIPAALVARALFTLGSAYLFTNGLGFVEILRYAVLPETICTAVFSLALYPIIYICVIPLRDRKDTSLR